MVGVALVLAALTLAGFVSPLPLPLLILTFALSAGDAFESPSWRAVLPDLVKKEDLPAASALNGIEFNFARAVGPGLAGLLIAAAGAGSAFLLNAVSFIGVIFVVARWKPELKTRTTPPETVRGATVAAIRYVRYSPAIRILLTRSGLVMFFASGLLALLPSLSHRKEQPDCLRPPARMLWLGCGVGRSCNGARAIPLVDRTYRERRCCGFRPRHFGHQHLATTECTERSHAPRRFCVDRFPFTFQCASSGSRS
jgi:MFS family permease